MHFQVSTKLTKEVDEEAGKKLKKWLKIAWIVGLIGIIVNLIISCTVYLDAEKDPLWLEIELYASAILFAFGLVLTLTVKSTEKKAQAYTMNAENRYEFFDDCVVTSSYRGEDKFAEVKNYFTEFTKIKKTEHYVLLHLGMRGAYPVEIAALTEEQLDWLLHIKDRPTTKPIVVNYDKKEEGQPTEEVEKQENTDSEEKRGE